MEKITDLATDSVVIGGAVVVGLTVGFSAIVIAIIGGLTLYALSNLAGKK